MTAHIAAALKLSARLTLAASLAALGSCASTPSVEPIDNALMARASSEGQARVAQARAARDAAEDAYAVAQSNTRTAKGRLELARASAKTMGSQLEESEVAAQVAEDNGSASDLQRAQGQLSYAMARADHADQAFMVAKAELKLAKVRERLALEQHRLSIAEVEFGKAQALQEVDLVAARQIPVADYREQVRYHRDEIEQIREQLRNTEEDLDDERHHLAEQKRKMDTLAPRL